MSARDEFPYANRLAAEQYRAMCDEIDRLRGLVNPPCTGGYGCSAESHTHGCLNDYGDQVIDFILGVCAGIGAMCFADLISNILEDRP